MSDDDTNSSKEQLLRSIEEEFCELLRENEGVVDEIAAASRHDGGRTRFSFSESFAARILRKVREHPPGNPLALPFRLGKYVLEEEIGRGGMGVIYRARDVSLERLVALKMILAGERASATELERFEREARAAARLDHPGIVPIYDTGIADGKPYIAMRLLEGGSLTARGAALDVSQIRIAALGEMVAHAVHYAHGQGVIHRDLKPGNIVFDDADRPFVTDFGLSRPLEVSTSLTETGALVGTLGYMAPELARGADQPPAVGVDVYGLGTILYQLLAGRPPFQARGPGELLKMVLELDVAPPSTFRGGISRDLETICLKCLEKEPHQRYATADDVARELQRFQAGKPVEARPVGFAGRLWRAAQRKPALAILASVCSVLFAAVPVTSGWYVWRVRAEQSLARRHTYVARLNLAARAWEDGQSDRGRRLLDSLRPKPGEEDFRDFAWGFLHDALKPELVSFQAHDRRVLGIGFVADSHSVVTTSFDGKGRLWDGRNGKLLVECRFDAEAAGTIVSRDGRLVAQRDATAGASQLVAWTLTKDPSPRFRRVRDWPGRFTGLGCADGGEFLVAFGTDLRLYLFDVETGARRVSRARTAALAIWEIPVSPDGREALTFHQDGEVYRWDLERLTSRKTDLRNRGVYLAARVSPDWRWLACPAGTGDDLELWDLRSEELRASRTFDSGDGVLPLDFSPDSVQLVIATGQARPVVHLVEVQSLRTLRRLVSHADRIAGAAWRLDGKRLLSVDLLGIGKVWDLERADSPDFHETRLGRYEAIAQTRDSGLVVAVRHGFVLESFAVAENRSRLVPHGTIAWQEPMPLFGRLSPSGIRAGLALKEGSVQVARLRWDQVPPTSEIEASLEGSGRETETILFDPTDRFLLVLEDTGHVVRWARHGHAESVSWQSARSFQVGNGASADAQIGEAALSPDGHILAVTLRGGSELRLFGALEGDERRVLNGHGKDVYGVAFDAEGRHLATSGRDREIRVWDLQSNAVGPSHRLQGHTNSVSALAFLPGSQVLVSGSDDGALKFWDLVTGAERATFMAHSHHVNAVHLLADGGTLVSAGGHRKMRIGELRLWTSQVHAKE